MSSTQGPLKIAAFKDGESSLVSNKDNLRFCLSYQFETQQGCKE